jgi:ADP-ribose pyrophosphatase YjhB (NUDIX family)
MAADDRGLKLLGIAKRLEAIAHTGLSFTESEYDRERYRELSELSGALMHHISDTPLSVIQNLFQEERDGYKTPKVDVRGVVFNDLGEILLVQERDNQLWALPGGWADIGFSPKEVVVKEVHEEAGIIVAADRVLAILDKKNHPHPPEPWYAYKIFIQCRIIEGTLADNTTETVAAQFFSRTNLPKLSENRNTRGQVEMMFSFLDNPERDVCCE